MTLPTTLDHFVMAEEIDLLRQENDDLRAEIARHHRDFAKWEDMADKGAQQIAENEQLRAEVQRLRDFIEAHFPPEAY